MKIQALNLIMLLKEHSCLGRVPWFRPSRLGSSGPVKVQNKTFKKPEVPWEK